MRPARRIAAAAARAIGLIAGIAVLIFVLVRAIPGDVVDVLGAEGGLTEAMKAEMRAEMGLSASWAEQFLAWAGRALEGDLGHSLRFNRPVIDLILHALPVTLTLAAWSFAAGLTLGVGVAAAAAVWPRSPVAGLVDALNVWSIAMPTFCVGIAGIFVFVLWLGWMPLLGNMVLPVAIIGIDVAGQIVKPLHEDIRETGTALFVRTARAKGLSRARVVLRHVLPNSLTVALALSGVVLGGLVGGTITMEVLFGLPGIGKLALDAVLGRDYPLIQGVVVLIAGGVVLVNFLTDAAARLVDPRLRGTT